MSRMKRKFFAFILLASASLSLSSCLSTDDDTNIEYTHDTAITAFSLGTLTRNYMGKTSAGKDTIYSASVTGSNYKFTIDQVNRLIYNTDSLPMGSKTSAVLATITAKQSSPMIWQDIDKDDSLYYYSSSDSVNFSKPRKLRVYNNDFTAYATYQITVNVHKEDADSFKWHSLAQQSAELASLSDMKALSLGNQIFVFGKDGETAKIYKSANTDGASWISVLPNVAFSKDFYQSVATLDGNIYVVDNGQVMKSADGENWESVCSNTSLLQLIGSSSRYLYAYSTSGIMVSKDGGVSWIAETLDTDTSYLPKNSLSLTAMNIRSTKNAENLLLMGIRDASKNDTIATLWTHTVDYNVGGEDGKWNYVEYDNRQPYKMPALDEIQVAVGDSGLVALGSNGKWYVSKKGGLTWTVDTTVVIPTEFDVNKRFAFVKDNNNFYWVINNGHVWKGRFNREGWRRD